jgi:arylesterase/paraoxonase
MASTFFSALWRSFAVLALVACLFYDLRLRPLLSLAGIWRDIEMAGNEACKTVPELQACESVFRAVVFPSVLTALVEIVLHRETGILYLACSDPHTRSRWMPAMSFYDPPARSTDYIATYDPINSEIERLVLTDYKHKFGIFVHGMDVVSSARETFLYLVNHRPHGVGNTAELGADSVIEVFKTTLGRAGELSHVSTVSHPLIMSPNDVVGSPDGKSFYFTNDNPIKIGHFVSPLLPYT